jgi:hypothetical protein
MMREDGGMDERGNGDVATRTRHPPAPAPPLQGAIPASWQQTNFLSYLDLSNSGFQGIIPNAWSGAVNA